MPTLHRRRKFAGTALLLPAVACADPDYRAVEPIRCGVALAIRSLSPIIERSDLLHSPSGRTALIKIFETQITLSDVIRLKHACNICTDFHLNCRVADGEAVV